MTDNFAAMKSLQESSGQTVFQSEINNTASRLLLDAVLFYWGNLDPVKSYNLTLSNLTPGSHLTLSSLTLYSATSELVAFSSNSVNKIDIAPF